MPPFAPFRGVRYDTARFPLADVTAPPYDVLSPADRAALVAQSPHNAVLIDLPTEDDGPDRYVAAGRRFQDWIAEGALAVDAEPTFTIYRMRATDDLGQPVHTLGVIGALELSEPGQGGILPHEHTTPKAKSDRLDLLRGTRANLSAVWGLSLTDGLSTLLASDDEPAASWTDDDGIGHDVWVLTDPERIKAISDAVSQSPVVIADGHHRYETSLAYRNERREESGGPTPADATLCFVVELTPAELTVRPIHRLLAGLPGTLDLVAELGPLGFEPVGTATADEVADGRVLAAMADAHAVAVVDPSGGATVLHVDPFEFDDVADLDSARLAQALGQLPPHDVTYQHGTDRVQSAVTSGDAQWGVLLRPATVDQIRTNADHGDRMPPKTTFFYPKPKTGIVFRQLD
ncbi:MAG TPA: DUF1015 domain-containing protein [Acidimicrobiales bacterium]